MSLIELPQGSDLFKSNAWTRVNPVNCVGVMGKGLALEFRQRNPEMFMDYQARCKRGDVRLGEPYLFRSRAPNHYVINFPTKHHWRDRSMPEPILKGLDYLLAHYKSWDLTMLAIPAVGCGNGGLNWGLMRPLFLQRLKRFQIPVELYPPLEKPLERSRSLEWER
jgi:O-acetyl-ADP-ribose deacetylase (regulator of RNase III)